MAVYEFQQKVVSEYRVEAENEGKALELLEEVPARYHVESYLDFSHDQENFFFLGETVKQWYLEVKGTSEVWLVPLLECNH